MTRGPDIVRQEFEEIIGTPPPSTVDTYRLVRGERRSRTARRTGIVATALVAAGLAGVLMLTNTTPAGTPPSGSASAGSPPAGSPPAGSPPAGSPPAGSSPPARDQAIELRSDTQESGNRSGRELARIVDGAVRKVAPEARWEPRLEIGFSSQGLPSWAGTGELHNGTKAGGFHLSAVEFPANHDMTNLMSCEDRNNCSRGTSPGGRPYRTRLDLTAEAPHFTVDMALPQQRLIRVIIAVKNATDAPVLTPEQVLAVVDRVAGQII